MFQARGAEGSAVAARELQEAGRVDAALHVLATDLTADDVSLIAGADSRPGAEEAFARAMELFAAGERVDMRALAIDLGIGRTSLYRRVSSRERLLGELTWHLLQRALREGLVRSRGQRGLERLSLAVAVYMDELSQERWLWAFLQREPSCALRVLLDRDAAPQRGLARALYTLLEAELQRGHLAPGLRPELLAYPIVRICESFLYLDLINGEQPDTQGALMALHALLHGHARPLEGDRSTATGSTHPTGSP